VIENALAATILAVSVLCAVYLLVPLFRPSTPPTIAAEDAAEDAVEAAYAAALRALADLELDWAVGKLSDEDYRAQRAAQEAEVAALLRRLTGGGTS
jgi:hypothetical protein